MLNYQRVNIEKDVVTWWLAKENDLQMVGFPHVWNRLREGNLSWNM